MRAKSSLYLPSGASQEGEGWGCWVKREEKAASIPWDACLPACLMPPWEKRKGWHFSLTIGLRGDKADIMVMSI